MRSCAFAKAGCPAGFSLQVGRGYGHVGVTGEQSKKFLPGLTPEQLR